MPFPRVRLRRRARAPLLVGALLLLAGCGGDDPAGPDPALDPFVGTWDARSLVMRSTANPEFAPDLIRDLGAEFTVIVQPSGSYTAILLYQQTPITELGTLEVDGDELVFNVSVPWTRTNRSRFTFSGVQRVLLVGDTQFDYDADGTPEDAEATIELIRR